MQSHVRKHAYSTGFGTCPAQFFDESMVLRDKAIGEVKITMNKVRGVWVPGVGYILSVSWLAREISPHATSMLGCTQDSCMLRDHRWRLPLCRFCERMAA